MDIEKKMIGKTIVAAAVSGYGMTLVFDDGKIFSYSASDGGHSSYGFDDEDEED